MQPFDILSKNRIFATNRKIMHVGYHGFASSVDISVFPVFYIGIVL